MERQTRLLTALSVILLLLLGVIVLQNRDGEEPRRNLDADAPPERDLFDFEKDALTSLEIEGPKGLVRFEKRDGSWTMTAPREAPVEAYKVTELVNRFDGLDVEERPITGDAATFGLAPEVRTRVSFGGPEGRTWTVYVGNDTSVGYRTYLQERDGGPVILATSKLADAVRVGPDDFRSRDVWKVSAGTVHRARIEAGDRVVVLRKDDHGWWLGDQGPRADEQAVRDWLYAQESLRGATFVESPDLAGLGLEPPAARITLEDDGGTHEARFGPPDAAGRAVRGVGDVMRLAPEGADPVKLDGWVSTRLLPVRRFQVDRFELALGETRRTWTRTDGQWSTADGAPAEGVDGVLDALEAVPVDRAPRPETAKPAEWGRITLAEGADRSEQVILGPPGPDGLHIGYDVAGGGPFAVRAADLAPLIAAASK